jgi:hypothetical protein
MLIDFWIAGYAGSAYLRLRSSKRKVWGRSPAACKVLAHGGSLPGGELRKTQIFAAVTWIRLAIASAVLAAISLFIGSPLPNGWERTTLLYLLLFFDTIAVLGRAQTAMINYRKNRTHRYLLRSGPSSLTKALDPGSPCLPRARDFWIVLIVVLAVNFLLFLNA